MKKYLQQTRNIKYLISFILISLLISCASYKPQYAHNETDEQYPNLPSKPLQHQVFLIGDGGGTEAGKPVKTLEIIGKDLQKATKNSTVLFLGDNIYPHGLPAEGMLDRPVAEQNLMNQLAIVEDFKGKIYFIPGNHDWEAVDGVEGVKRQKR